MCACVHEEPKQPIVLLVVQCSVNRKLQARSRKHKHTKSDPHYLACKRRAHTHDDTTLVNNIEWDY